MRVLALLLAAMLALSAPPPQPIDAFAFFGASAPLTQDDRARLDRGMPVVRTVPARGQSVAVFAAVPVAITGDRLVAWVQDITAFKHGPPVQQIGRFSNPPRLDDLAGLTFPEGDCEDAITCRPGDCALKISSAEIAALKYALATSPIAQRQDVLRALLLRRVQTYLAEGLHAVAPYANGEGPIAPAAAFAAMIDESGFLRQHAPDLAVSVESWHGTNGSPNGGTGSFLYWAKEHYGGKPIVSVTHVFVAPAKNGGPEALIASKQIFATHYLDAWLGVTALVRDPATGQAYFVYIVRTSVDVVRGFWGGLVRRIMQRRLKSEGVALVEAIRRRLERGLPPSATTAPAMPRR